MIIWGLIVLAAAIWTAAIHYVIVPLVNRTYPWLFG